MECCQVIRYSCHAPAGKLLGYDHETWDSQPMATGLHTLWTVETIIWGLVDNNEAVTAWEYETHIRQKHCSTPNMVFVTLIKYCQQNSSSEQAMFLIADFISAWLDLSTGNVSTFVCKCFKRVETWAGGENKSKWTEAIESIHSRSLHSWLLLIRVL